MAPIDRILKVEGQVPQHVGIELADLAYNVSGQHVIVDVGAYRGRSAAYLAYGANRGGKAVVHAIDAWDLPGNKAHKSFRYNHPGSRKAARYNVRAQGFANDIVLTRDWSVKAAVNWNGRPVGLLHIDGDPSMIKNDILAWMPNMATMGVIVVSDYHRNSKAAQAVAELAADNQVNDYSVSNGLILIQIPPEVETVHAGDHVGFSGEWVKAHEDAMNLDTGADQHSNQYTGLFESGGFNVHSPESVPSFARSEPVSMPEPDGSETEPVPMPEHSDPEAEPVPMPDQDTAHTIDTEPDNQFYQQLYDMTGKELRDYMKSIGMKLGPSRPKRDMIADIRSFLETGA